MPIQSSKIQGYTICHVILKMSGIFLSTRLISFVSKNHRFANPIKQPIISSASPVKMSGIFRSTRLISFVSKNHRLTNPIKPAYPVNPPPPHFSTTPPRRPKRSTSPPTRTKDRYASSGWET